MREKIWFKCHLACGWFNWFLSPDSPWPSWATAWIFNINFRKLNTTSYIFWMKSEEITILKSWSMGILCKKWNNIWWWVFYGCVRQTFSTTNLASCVSHCCSKYTRPPAEQAASVGYRYKPIHKNCTWQFMTTWSFPGRLSENRFQLVLRQRLIWRKKWQRARTNKTLT